MKKEAFILIVSGFITILVGCSSSDESADPTLFTINTFEKDAEGWIGEFADYPDGLEDSMKLSFNYGSFTPSEAVGDLSAIIQTGHATNSDLFMFVKKQMAGLEPDQSYSVIFDIEFYAQLNDDYNGDLSGENTGSFLKAGAFTFEPVVKTLEDENSGTVQVITDFDIGETSSDGTDMVNLGKLELTDFGDIPIILYGYSEDSPIIAEADDQGKIWLAIGVDTNVPIYQSIYYSKITVSYQNVSQPD